MATPDKTPCDCGKGETHYRTSYKLCGKRKRAPTPPPGAPGSKNPNIQRRGQASYWASGTSFAAALKPGDCFVELHYRGSVFRRDITAENLEYDESDPEIDGNTVFAFFDNDKELVKKLADEEVRVAPYPYLICNHLIRILSVPLRLSNLLT